jgi:branched-chain amino acid transport system permease protein
MRITFRKSYKQDIRLFRDGAQAAWYLGFLALALIMPMLVDGYYLDELSFVFIYAIAGLGLMILTGFSGQVSFGHAAFVAIGAYAHTILLTRFGVPWVLSVPLAALISGFAGLALGRICSKMHGLYLAIATLAFAIIVERLIGSGGDFTGGHGGMPVPDISLFGVELFESWQKYFVNLTIFVGVLLLVRNLTRSRSGRAMVSVRDSEVSARGLGVDIAFFKAHAFFLSAALAGKLRHVGIDPASADDRGRRPWHYTRRSVRGLLHHAPAHRTQLAQSAAPGRGRLLQRPRQPSFRPDPGGVHAIRTRWTLWSLAQDPPLFQHLPDV